MPVRFQVDPDFYDHPKTAGMSDAAFSLWVRAGSFSAAKLTDGFVAEAVLVHTLRSDTRVADELVERGLWRRRRGGYVFHEWSERNLTKQRVQDHHHAEAKRKREERQKRQQQVKGQNVRPDADRTWTELRAESGTVGVGVGVKPPRGHLAGDSHEGTARAKQDPPRRPRCAHHHHLPAEDPGPNCVRCREARLAAEQRQHDAYADQRAVVRSWRAVVAACPDCDDNGFIESDNGMVRHHGKPGDPPTRSLRSVS